MIPRNKSNGGFISYEIHEKVQSQTDLALEEENPEKLNRKSLQF
ncbi:hypothetical protein STRDD13_00660 [Streptococcus sp. DD13]|nr:hypothetical protein STRDD13_00660 [Streptococcus sp. DD13]